MVEFNTTDNVHGTISAKCHPTAYLETGILQQPCFLVVLHINSIALSAGYISYNIYISFDLACIVNRYRL